MENLIGIDLGTTNSCVAVWKNNRIQIVPNVMGKRVTPSFISIDKKEILVGDAAKNQIIRNPENTIYDTKRLIGRNFSDKIVQEDMKYWNFKVKGDKNDKPMIIAKVNEKEKTFSPEQISAMILKELKKYAEDYLGKEVKDAVITVPANFNNSQREATIEAGRLAGLNVIRTINEPTAAAIAYGIENPTEEEKKICVFDFGGGTLDVTILMSQGINFVIQATGGDTHLGGEDIDNLLVEYCIKNFKEETGIDISKDKKALRRLKNECEKHKKYLSGVEETDLDIDCLNKGEDFNITIDRHFLGNLCQDIFERCMKILKETLKESGFKKEEIDEVVLVGGSSRIPKIQEMIKEYFGNNKFKLSKKINPDEAVAYGAAIVGNIKNLKIKDVIPLTLGVGSKENMIPMIKKNTQIPFSFVKTFKTIQDNQSEFGIGIYEGEDKLLKNNILLDNFYLRNITKAPKGETKMEISFNVDQNGILSVSAKEIGKNNNKKEIKVERIKRE